MNVVFHDLTHDGEQFLREEITWPDGWPFPVVGQTIRLPNGYARIVLRVDVWPHGDADDEGIPFVHVTVIQISQKERA